MRERPLLLSLMILDIALVPNRCSHLEFDIMLLEDSISQAACRRCIPTSNRQPQIQPPTHCRALRRWPALDGVEILAISRCESTLEYARLTPLAFHSTT